MAIILSLLALSAILLFHELGHAFASESVGRKVHEVGFGLPLGSKISFGKFSIYPFCPLGAFIRNDESADAKEYHDNAFVYGAGPFASFLAGYFLIVSAGLVAILENPGIPWQRIVYGETFYVSLAMFAVLFLTMILVRIAPFWRKFVFSFLMPLLSFIVLAKLLFVGGMTGIVAIAGTAIKTSEISGGLYFAGNISIGVGLAMMLPLYPLDGANILRPLATKHLPKFVANFDDGGKMLLGLLVIYVMQNDLMPVLLPFFKHFF